MSKPRLLGSASIARLLAGPFGPSIALAPDDGTGGGGEGAGAGAGGEGGSSAPAGDPGAVLDGGKPEGGDQGDQGATGDQGKGEGGDGDGSDKGDGDGDKGDAEGFDPAKVTLPEGVEVDAKAMEQFAPIAKELGLNQEAGNKLLGLYTELQQKQAEQWTEMQRGWAEEIRTDKEFGGPQFQANADKANGLIRRFGDDAFKEYLVMSGTGNNPAFFRFMSRIAAVVGEDVPPTLEPGGSNSKPSRLDVLYPSNA